MFRNIKSAYLRELTEYIFLLLLFINIQSCNTTEPAEDLQPGQKRLRLDSRYIIQSKQ